MKTKPFFILCVSAFLFSCVKEPELNKETEKYIEVVEENTAIGSMKDGADKNVWGDFEIILGIDRKSYTVGEPINVSTYFSNIGNKTIVLDGIYPHRSSANPPKVELFINDSVRFETDKVLDHLENDNKIVIDPNEKIVLNRFNLLDVDGYLSVLNATGFFSPKQMNLKDTVLETGTYSIQFSFEPTPQIYWSTTDTLAFVIE